MPLALSQDVGGPLARTVTDVALMLDATAGADSADPITSRGTGHIPRSYASGLDANALKGARLGVLVPLFGSAPEDAAVAAVVHAAIQQMAQHGAEPVDVTLAIGTEAELSLIRFEFKFNLNDYLAHTPRAPVRTLDEILEKKLFHPSLEQGFRRSNELEVMETDEYRTIAARQADLRERLLKAMDDGHLTALVYPTLRRTSAKIGEPQTGGNCSASAVTGLPAITVPAGFAEDGMPVGVELLGRPFAEADLLKLAFAFEQATRSRRPPSLMPAIRP